MLRAAAIARTKASQLGQPSKIVQRTLSSSNPFSQVPASNAQAARKAFDDFHTNEDLHGFDAASILSESGETRKDAAMRHFTGQSVRLKIRI